MTRKIKEKFENINNISKKILKYGSIVSCILIITGITMLYIMPNKFIAQEFIKSSTMVWAEIVIGSLFFDFIL